MPARKSRDVSRAAQSPNSSIGIDESELWSVANRRSGDAIRRFLQRRLENLPDVAFDADGEVRLRLAEGEHFLDGGVRS